MVVIVQSVIGYRPPSGYRIVSSRVLENGMVEVQLEPFRASLLDHPQKPPSLLLLGVPISSIG